MSVNETLSETEKAIQAVNKSFNEMTASMLKTGEGYDVIVNGLGNVGDSISSTGEAINKMFQTARLDPIGGIFKSIGDAIGGVATAASKAASLYGTVIDTLDSASQPTRMLERDLYNLSAQFGGTYEEAKVMAEYMLDYADEVATKDFGYINLSETKQAAEEFRNARIPIAMFGETIDSTAGRIDILNTGILHAQALGISSAKYFDLMGHAVLKQGLSAQDAAEQMAMFGDMADVTGLTVETIATSLHGLTGEFTKLGLTADFGRPLLEGFARTLTNMGLGIENSTALAEGLGSALANLAENYSMAYVMAQRGGLEFGAGGGALGASIELQAKMLRAEEEPGGQAAVALEMAGAMKETLESFTGGGIITVEEAAASPELQQTFYTQQKLLEQMFGLDNKTATRTLDYLSQLDEVTATGNKDMINALGEQIDNTINTRDATIDEMDKLNATSNAQLAQLQLQSSALFGIMRATGGTFRELPEELITKAVGMAGEKTGSIEDQMLAFNEYVSKNIDRIGQAVGTREAEGERAFSPTGNRGATPSSGDNNFTELKDLNKSVIRELQALINSLNKERELFRSWMGR